MRLKALTILAITSVAARVVIAAVATARNHQFLEKQLSITLSVGSTRIEFVRIDVTEKVLELKENYNIKLVTVLFYFIYRKYCIDTLSPENSSFKQIEKQIVIMKPGRVDKNKCRSKPRRSKRDKFIE